MTELNCRYPAYEAGALTTLLMAPFVRQVGFEPTKPFGNGFTVRPTTPTEALKDNEEG